MNALALVCVAIMSAAISFAVAFAVVRSARNSLKIAVDPHELAKVVGTIEAMLPVVTRQEGRIKTLEGRVLGAKP